MPRHDQFVLVRAQLNNTGKIIFEGRFTCLACYYCSGRPLWVPAYRAVPACTSCPRIETRPLRLQYFDRTPDATDLHPHIPTLHINPRWLSK